jgi:two-component system nitrate/nitrite response regulator NarL
MSDATSPPIRLLLVDDHAMFREGLARMLEKEPDFEIAGQVDSAVDALAQAGPGGATVVLLDVDLGPQRAIDFLRGAREAGFVGKTLVVTAGVSDQEAVRLVQAGVVGILHKHHSTGVLCDAIRRVTRGEVCLENAYLAPLFRTVNKTDAPKQPALTDRDRTIMRFLLQGLTNREMGGRLNISEGAVKASLHHVCQKLGVRTRAQLVKVTLEQYKDEL